MKGAVLGVLRVACLLPLAACISSVEGEKLDALTTTSPPDIQSEVGLCEPDCDDRVCGDNGCGGSCGTCALGSTCADGACLCIAACGGKACGDDGCGGSCGSCGDGTTCLDGACKCTPSCANKTCGDDGCGGSCGTCLGCFGAQPDLCDGGTCTVPCCDGCGLRECGEDGCGLSCGTCDSDDTCRNGACECVADCTDKTCGDDGCGGSCGGCEAGEGCSGGHCVSGCVGSCEGKSCGDDGCGTSCGGCDSGKRCDAGACVCAPSCVGRTCGDDGCGGSCGTCGDGLACAADGHCACAPSCGARKCGPDGCGDECGACGPGTTCDGAGQCACVPDCTGKLCGDNGCSGSCGACDAHDACISGACECVPDCGGSPAKQCGSDGCVGSCGTCAEPNLCTGGLCLPPPDAVYSTFIGDWSMQPAAEITKCVLKRLTNTTDIVVTSIHTKLAPGSHHMIVYRSAETTERPDAFNCTPFLETLGGSAAPLMITQVPEETLTFPPGVGIRLEAGQMVRIEAHYLNYFTQPITAHGDVDFRTAGGASVTQLADFLFYGTTTFAIPAHSTYTSNWVYLDVPNGAGVFAITGHTHKYGTNVEARIASGSNDAGTLLYPGSTPFNWAEAPVVKFDPPVSFGAGTGFRIRCSWNNTSGSTLYFGESASKEMCFIWAYYYPSEGYRLCADGLFAPLCTSDN